MSTEKEAAKAAKQAEKEAAKAAKQAEKEAAKAAGNSGIEVGDPEILRPRELPLVVKLPADASSAQIEYAKLLNSYAYANVDKWKIKKAVLIKRLELLAGVEIAPNENSRLEINKTVSSFLFIPDGRGGEIFAGATVPAKKQ